MVFVHVAVIGLARVFNGATIAARVQNARRKVLALQVAAHVVLGLVGVVVALGAAVHHSALVVGEGQDV